MENLKDWLEVNIKSEQAISSKFDPSGDYHLGKADAFKEVLKRLSVPAQQGVEQLAQIDIPNFIKAAFQILVGRGEDAMYQYMKDKKVDIRPAAQPLQQD